jgi:hypothetical protein
VDPRAGLDDVKKRKFLTLPGLELQSFSRPARSQSLYRPRYPGFYKSTRTISILNPRLLSILNQPTGTTVQYKNTRTVPVKPGRMVGLLLGPNMGS